jgi:DNA topoisomerase IB
VDLALRRSATSRPWAATRAAAGSTAITPTGDPVRDETKYGQLADFGKVLPAIRRRVQRDLRRKGLPREKVLATVVELMEKTMMRVGNEEYARANQSFGLTTLRDRHVKLAGSTLKFQFKGKSGKVHSLTGRRPAAGEDRQGVPGHPGAGPLPVRRRGGPAGQRRLGRPQRLPARDLGRRAVGEDLPHLGGDRARAGRAP